MNLANLNVDVSEIRKTNNGIYPGWVGYQKITITTPEETPDDARIKYNLTMKSTNEFDDSDATDNLTYVIYKCDVGGVCTTLEEDDIYDQGELKVKDILDYKSEPTGVKAYYFDGAEFNIDTSITDYTISSPKVLPNTGSNSKSINEGIDFKKGNVHIYYIVYTLHNSNHAQDDLQGATFTTEFNVEVDDINESINEKLYSEIAKK